MRPPSGREARATGRTSGPRPSAAVVDPLGEHEARVGGVVARRTVRGGQAQGGGAGEGAPAELDRDRREGVEAFDGREAGEGGRVEQARAHHGRRGQRALGQLELDAAVGGDAPAGRSDHVAALDLLGERVEGDVLVADVEQHLGGARARRDHEVGRAGGGLDRAAELVGFRGAGGRARGRR